jgi:hypothetical protein
MKSNDAGFFSGSRALDEISVPYMIVGHSAVIRLGQRTTYDVISGRSTGSVREIPRRVSGSEMMKNPSDGDHIIIDTGRQGDLVHDSA